MVGRSLGHYEILELLGAGGMGEVYRARDTKLERDVAIKVLPENVATDPDRLARLEREARLLAALNHPHIATIHSLEEAEGARFLVLELVKGESLEQRLARGALPVERALDVCAQIAEALETAHLEGIIHRDLKPANVLITPDGRAKVLDFGIAKAQSQDRPVAETASATELTAEGTMIGTAPYMSPEQVRGREVDARSDIWAFGCVLYETLTGQKTFARETVVDTLAAIIEVEPEWDALPATTPEAIRSLLRRCLHKDYDRRLHNVGDARIEIEDTVAHPVVRARPRWLVPAASILLTSLIVVAITLSTFFSAAALPFRERDWILITAFENLTGEEVFDDSLQTALTVGIDRSSYVNVVPARRIQDALARMTMSGGVRVDEEIGREIAEREGISVLLVPSISKVGEEYVISAIIQEVTSGESLWSDIARARGQAEVLGALDALTGRVREALGEGAAAIQEQGKPLVEVTTSSLEALKQYSLGNQKLRASDFDEARTYYQNALRIDPGFTTAKASLGMLHFDQGRKGLAGFDPEEGKRLIGETIASVEELTDKERYGILAFHAWAVENDPGLAEEHYKALMALYPDNSAAHNNLGWLYQNTGRYREAIAEYEEAIRIDPNLMITYDGMIYIYLNMLGELDAAIAAARRQLDRDETHAQAYDSLGWAYLGKGDLAEAEEAFSTAVTINPRLADDWYRLAHARRLQGDYDGAIEALQGVATANPADGWVAYHRGVVYQLMGNEAKAREQFEEFKPTVDSWVEQYPDNLISHHSQGLVLARLGDVDGAEAALQAAIQLNASAHFENAQLRAVLGRNEEALDDLQRAIDGGFRNFVWMWVHPDLISLYDEPRFQEMLSRGLR